MIKKSLLAQNLISDQALIINNFFDVSQPELNQNSDLTELESHYVNLWDEFFVDDFIVEINPLIRPVVSSLLDSVSQLSDDDEISFEVAKSIDKMIFAAIFNYEIGNKSKSIDLLTDVFVDIRNINPEKIDVQKTLTFDELEDTLLNLMKKSDTVMSKSIKNEVGFIFARGLGPIHSDDIFDLVDILSKSRYLDVVSRKQSDLYRLVQNDWESLKSSLQEKESISKLLESHNVVSDLHKAAVLLRDLDDVERFISSNSEEK